MLISCYAIDSTAWNSASSGCFLFFLLNEKAVRELQNMIGRLLLPLQQPLAMSGRLWEMLPMILIARRPVLPMTSKCTHS